MFEIKFVFEIFALYTLLIKRSKKMYKDEWTEQREGIEKCTKKM
jgi:hypothetical protein